jgi:hypothetical protein
VPSLRGLRLKVAEKKRIKDVELAKDLGKLLKKKTGKG